MKPTDIPAIRLDILLASQAGLPESHNRGDRHSGCDNTLKVPWATSSTPVDVTRSSSRVIPERSPEIPPPLHRHGLHALVCPKSQDPGRLEVDAALPPYECGAGKTWGPAVLQGRGPGHRWRTCAADGPWRKPRSGWMTSSLPAAAMFRSMTQARWMQPHWSRWDGYDTSRLLDLVDSLDAWPLVEGAPPTVPTENACIWAVAESLQLNLEALAAWVRFAQTCVKPLVNLVPEHEQ